MIIMLCDKLELRCGYMLKNRIAKAALTEHMADANHNLTEEHYRLYRRWSESGASLLLTGNIMIDPEDLENEENVVINSYEKIDSLKRWIDAGGENLWLQIGHAGALSNSKRPLSPSGVAYEGKARSFGLPYVMNEKDIQNVIEKYSLVAGMAKEAGFAGIEIHSAHGFLLNQFLSPLTNRRTDKYGGSLENRARLLLEVVEKVRRKVGVNYPIAVKINTSDKGDQSCEDARLKVCKLLDDSGIDIIELSGGDYDNTLMIGRDRPKEYFVHFAEQMRESGIKCAIMATGGMRDVKRMNEFLDKGVVDIIGLGRPFITDPDVAKKILEGTLKVIPDTESDSLPVMEQLQCYWKAMRELSQ